MNELAALNYHHLRYFWVVAREGGVTRASRKLHVSQPAVSSQLRELEHALGEKLFVRVGRGLALTDAGRLVHSYAEQIFMLGRELTDTLSGRPGRLVRLNVGIAMVVPKLLAYRFLEPALRLPEPVQILCVEDRPERLLSELAVHNLDLALADTPVTSLVKVRAYSHLLGECPVAVFATPRLAKAHGRGFPRSLEGAPMLLPTEISTLRRSLDGWFDASGIRPRVVGEFDDGALLGAFGQEGAGLFPAPAVIEAEIRRQYRVVRVGTLETVRQRFYAVSGERRLKHPAVVALTRTARSELFGWPKSGALPARLVVRRSLLALPPVAPGSRSRG
jgi:LysR family transcriptional activator of nhaA